MATTQPKHPTTLLRRQKGGFSLVEAVMALSITGLLMGAVATQLVESAALSLRVTNTLEHSRNARETIDLLSVDIRSTQILRLYPSFTDRTREARDGESGNYLVLQNVDSTGTITRTVGYYASALPHRAGWGLYRHDSQAGDNPADSLPSASATGNHRMVKRAVRLPDSNHLFRSVRDRGVSIHGEFGLVEGGGPRRSEFIRNTIFTRS